MGLLYEEAAPRGVLDSWGRPSAAPPPHQPSSALAAGMESEPPAEGPLVCAECGRESEPDAEGVQPDVCGSETIIRPFSYDAVIEDAPQEHTCWAPAEPAHDATTNSAAAATLSFPRVCAKTSTFLLS